MLNYRCKLYCLHAQFALVCVCGLACVCEYLVHACIGMCDACVCVLVCVLVCVCVLLCVCINMCVHAYYTKGLHVCASARARARVRSCA